MQTAIAIPRLKIFFYIHNSTNAMELVNSYFHFDGNKFFALCRKFPASLDSDKFKNAFIKTSEKSIVMGFKQSGGWNEVNLRQIAAPEFIREENKSVGM